MTKWRDLQSLSMLYGDRLFEVEHSEDPDATFVEASYSRTHVPLAAVIAYLSLPRKARRKVGRVYLAQTDLFDAIPELKEDLPTPELFGTDLELYRTAAWLGASDTITPIHRDPYHNLFCQVVGRKNFIIFAPGAAPRLHLFSDPTRRNTSQIDNLEDPRWGLADVPSYQGAVDEGDALYLPKGWFHRVEAEPFDGKQRQSKDEGNSTAGKEWTWSVSFWFV
jgi:lysine-specific demethylase 8